MPNAAASSIAIAENRNVFHSAASVSASASTRQESPATKAFAPTAPNGSTQQNSSTSNAAASSSRSPADCGLRGAGTRTVFPAAVLRLRRA